MNPYISADYLPPRAFFMETLPVIGGFFQRITYGAPVNTVRFDMQEHFGNPQPWAELRNTLGQYMLDGLNYQIFVQYYDETEFKPHFSGGYDRPDRGFRRMNHVGCCGTEPLEALLETVFDHRVEDRTVFDSVSMVVRGKPDNLYAEIHASEKGPGGRSFVVMIKTYHGEHVQEKIPDSKELVPG